MAEAQTYIEMWARFDSVGLSRPVVIYHIEIENHLFQLHLARSRQSIPVSASQSAAEALQQAGFQIDIKCKDGLCGVCAVGYTEGAVAHRDFVLSKMQQQSKLTLCCSRATVPSGSITLDL